MIRVMSTLVGCTCFLLEAPRGPFYRHKGPRSRWKQSRKANLAFYRVAHRTVRCTPDTVRCPISFLNWRSRPLAARGPLAHRTVRCPLLAVGSATCPAQIARPTVGSPDSPVNFSRTPSANSRERPLHAESAWRTGHCPVHHRTVRCARLS